MMAGESPADDEMVVGALAGFKAARIVIGPHGPVFAGAGIGTTYGPTDQAVCVTDRTHVPPLRECGCGFYAWHERTRALALIDEVRVAVLDVELWGRFDVYEFASIAAAQVVRRVTLFPTCVACLTGREPDPQPAIGLGTAAAPEIGDDLVPVCDDHAGQAGRVFDVAQLAAAFGIEVGWARADDPLAGLAGQIGSVPTPPFPLVIRRLDELVAGESAHVFANAIAQDRHGTLWIDPQARLVQPLPGTDIPIRLTHQGRYELDLTGLTLPGWRPRTDDPDRYATPTLVVGRRRRRAVVGRRRSPSKAPATRSTRLLRRR